MVDRTYYISDCSLCVSSLRTVQQKTEPLFTCKNIRVTCCSCRLRVSPLKQETHKTRNHFWLNPQLPQNHHYPNAQRRKRGERTQTLEGVRLEAALSFFLGRGKIKFHQHAEVATSWVMTGSKALVRGRRCIRMTLSPCSIQ